MTLADLDLLLRYAATALILLAAVSGLRGGGWIWSLTLGGLAVTLVCYLLGSSPFVPWAGQSGVQVLQFGAAVVPVFLAWTVLTLVTENPRQYWPLVLAAAVGSVLPFALDALPVLAPVRGLIVASVYVAMMVIVAVGDRDDLVPARRLLRRGLLVAMLALGVGITAVEITFGSAPLPGWVYIVQAAAFLILGAAAVMWFREPARDIWPAAERPAPPGDVASKAQVLSAMDAGIWKTEGLTIGAMAHQLGLPDHRLRKVINQDLGYRNFSAFLNDHRIAYARGRLADPSERKTTVLEIAYDSGFSSLSPFNKAFREAEGCSPTAFREKKLIQSEKS